MEAATGIRVKEYLATAQPPSIFDELVQNGAAALFHRCDTTDCVGTVTKNDLYDLTFRPADAAEGAPEATLSKVNILYVCRPEDRTAIARQTKDPLRAAEPLRSPAGRYHIKNKTLYPLMTDRAVVFLTLLDNTVVRGLITGFNRYEIRVSLKGDVPIVALRHGILAAQTKEGRSILRQDTDNGNTGHTASRPDSR